MPLLARIHNSRRYNFFFFIILFLLNIQFFKLLACSRVRLLGVAADCVVTLINVFSKKLNT